MSEKILNNLKEILNRLPEKVRDPICAMSPDILENLEEVRMNACGKVTVQAKGRQHEVDISDGSVNQKDVEDVLHNLLSYSYYAYEEELAKGYITIEGGHRVGVCGRAVIDNGKVTLIKDISSLNLRRSREIIGASDKILDYVLGDSGINNTLIVSPPKCGKTTLLRDLARNLSYRGYRIGLCDERSEVAGTYLGNTSFDLGPGTDILDGCPKSEGMVMLIRSMSPEIVMTDEIGKQEDIKAIETALCAGVNIITTIHGSNYNDVLTSPIGETVSKGIFKKLIFLHNDPVTGSVKEVVHV